MMVVYIHVMVRNHKWYAEPFIMSGNYTISVKRALSLERKFLRCPLLGNLKKHVGRIILSFRREEIGN